MKCLVQIVLFTLFLRDIRTQMTSCTGGAVGVNPASYTSSTSGQGANSAFILEDPLYQITCCGAITSWEIATSGSGGITLQVWRKLSVNVYQLIGQNVFSAGSGTHTPADRIMVQHGDYIGWLSNGASMKYGSGSSVLNRVVTTMTSLQTGDYYDWSSVSPEGVSRNYAIRATVSASTPPTFGSIPSLVTFAEETPENTVVYSLPISDADSTDILTLYTKSETSGYFAVDSSTFQIKTKQDHIPLGSTYKVAVKVVDTCHKEATATVTLSVSNSDITMSITPTTSTVLENSSEEQWLADLIVSDPMNRYSCSLQTANVPFIVRQNSSGILGYSLYLKKWPQLDTSGTSSYSLSAECTDGTSTKTASHTVSVTVNSKPTISNLGSGVTVTLDARTVLIGHFVYNVTASDSEGDDISFSLTCSPSGCPFKIYDSGAILLTSRLITHTVTSYTLTVRVRDAYTSSANSGTLTVSITNRNTSPSLTIPALTSVSENSPLGHSVLTVTSSDVESGTLSVYGVFTPAYGLKYFDLNETSGVVTTSTLENIDYDIISTKDIVLVVYTSDGIAITSQTGAIRIVDVNEPCNFTEDYYRIIREEGSSGSTFPLPDYNIIDPDNGETFTFQKTCAGVFDAKVSVDTNSGQFSLSVDYDLDVPGTSPSFNCTLTVTDSAGHSDTAVVGVFIEYKNEFAPTFSLSSISITLQSHELIGAIVTNFTAQDSDLSTQDDGRFYYTLDQSSNTKEYFGIMSNGSLYIKEDLTPLYLGKTLSMTLTAKDYGNPSKQSSLAITIQIPISTTTLASVSTDKSLNFEEDNKNAVLISLVGLASVALFCTLFVLITKNCHNKMTKSQPGYNLLKSEPPAQEKALNSDGEDSKMVKNEAGTNDTHDRSKSQKESHHMEHNEGQDTSWSHAYAQNSNKEESDDKW